ncbi:MAG TPA: penicillin acylase family protein [Trueperaceae bacterium]|nr:penicillin acylase family protein [Trueperaceae bacterium]
MRLFGRVVLVLLLLVVVLVAGGYFYLRTSLPKVSGEVRVEGLEGPVEIVRDADAVPHIYASSHADAVFGLGFVHAQDRLWQMEFQRRVGSGRLSEVIGEATVSTDRFIRTLGIEQAAESGLEALSPEARGLIDAYVAGINAYLAQRRGALPVEFLLLGFEPAPFEPVDVLVWAKMMAWDLGDNWSDELLRAQLVKQLAPADVSAMIAELWPGYDDAATVVVPEGAAEYLRDLDVTALLELAGPPKPDGYGSNNWVLSGDVTATGKPILANDPHLSLQAPSLWYFAHLVAPGVNVMGATLPGTPAVLLGRTDRHAWGFTNNGADVQDLFLERLDPSDAGRYLTPDGSEPFTTRQEVIKVKGQDDVVVQVRSTRHGPVISDVDSRSREVAGGPLGGPDEVLAFSWTALAPGDRTIESVLGMNTATSWGEFEDALELFVAPMQNIVYADVDGVVAYYAPAHVPIRAGGIGAVPTRGWTGEGDWIGQVPFDALPHVIQPASGRIVTANQRVVPEDYPYYLTRDWTAPYRAERINALLDGQERATVDYSVATQLDQVSLMAREFVPLAQNAPAATDGAKKLQAMLVGFDGDMVMGSPAPLAFAAWYRRFAYSLYQDDLGDVTSSFFNLRPDLTRAILAGDPDWCDDKNTPGIETCEQMAALALDAAWTELVAAFGADTSKWSWGKAHQAVQEHAVLGSTPLAPIANLRVPNGGDGFSVDAAGYGLKFGNFDQTHGPGYRAVYDLAGGGGWFIHGTGQSGNLLSRRYRDFMDRWQQGDMIPMRMTRGEAEKGAVGTLRLQPAQ